MSIVTILAVRQNRPITRHLRPLHFLN